jgi:hypothetical protein
MEVCIGKASLAEARSGQGERHRERMKDDQRRVPKAVSGHFEGVLLLLGRVVAVEGISGECIVSRPQRCWRKGEACWMQWGSMKTDVSRCPSIYWLENFNEKKNIMVKTYRDVPSRTTIVDHKNSLSGERA